MRYKSMLLALFCCTCIPALAQTLNWSKTLSGKEIDILERYDDRKVLVGTYDLVGYAWGPGAGRLHMIDVHNGDTLWSYVRGPAYRDIKILTGGDTLICYATGLASDHRSHEFFALDAATGTAIWSLKRDTQRFDYYPLKDQFRLIDVSNGTLKASTLRLQTGETKELFTLEFPKDSVPINYRLTAQGLLLFYAHKLQKIDDAGNISWTVQFPFPNAVLRPVLQELGDEIIVINTDIGYLIDAMTGSVKRTFAAVGMDQLEKKYKEINQEAALLKVDFKQLLSGEKTFFMKKSENAFFRLRSRLFNEYAIKFILPVDDGFIVEFATDNGISTIYRESPSGDKLWELRETLNSDIFFSNEFFYFTSSTKAFKVNTRTGEITEKDLPDNFPKDRAFPNKIQRWNDKILVLNEMAVCVYTPDLAVELCRFVEGAITMTSGYQDHRQSFFSMSSGRATEDPTAIIQGINMSFNSYYTMQLQMLKTNYAANRGNMSAIDIQGTEMSMRMYQEAQRDAAVSAAIVSAIGTLGSAIGAALDGVELDNRLVGKGVARNHAGFLLSHSLQGNYFIRPYLKDGWFVAIIDLRNGARANIKLASYNKYLNANSTNSFPVLIDVANNQLLTRQISDDAELYEQRAIAEHPSMSRWPAKQLLPRPSLSAVGLGTLKFSEKPDDRWKPATLPDLDQQLIANIKVQNLDKVKDLIEGGADPNAIDLFGTSCLMYAALTNNHALYKLVYSSGASASYIDPSNFSVFSLMRYHQINGIRYTFKSVKEAGFSFKGDSADDTPDVKEGEEGRSSQ